MRTKDAMRRACLMIPSPDSGRILLIAAVLGLSDPHSAHGENRGTETKNEARGLTSWAAPDACARDPVCFDHAERAREASRQGQLDEALKEYQAAFGLQPMPRLVFNIARIQQKLGQLADATRTYELYLNLGAEGDKEMAAKARSFLDEIYVITEPVPGPWTPPKPPPPPPVYQRPWFWVVLIGSVGAAATGLTVGLLPKPSNPSDIVIYRPF